jgi:carbonic anhydrase/acetyltransferase-like protein (isoleucine patch superfamily)
VVLPGARVAADAIVRDSIVGPRSVVGAGALVDELTVLGDDVSVDPGTSLRGAKVPEPT